METISSQNKISGRQSNIELLRIISMILIILFHFSTYVDFGFPTSSISLNRLWVQFLYSGGRIGVNLFVMISGYFLITSQRFKTEKALKLWTQVFTYSVLAFAAFVVFGGEAFGVKKLIKAVLPMTYQEWWFASAYFILYLFSPFINKLLTGFDRKTYQKFLALAFVLWSVIPTFTNTPFLCNQFIWFVFVYSVAGYIRLHFNSRDDSAGGGRYLLLSAAAYAVSFLSVIALDLIGIKIPTLGEHATYFFAMQRVPSIIVSTFLFIGFTRIRIKNSRVINTLASSVFGVYLIHENPYVRVFIWTKVFGGASGLAGSKLLVAYSLGVAFAIFVFCAAIELLRINTLERFCSKLLGKISDKIVEKTERIFSGRFFEKT